MIWMPSSVPAPKSSRNALRISSTTVYPMPWQMPSTAEAATEFLLAKALHAVMIFIVTYLMFILAGTVFGTMLGVDLTTSFTGAVASMGNVGPGFGEVGSMDNFSAMPAAFKVSNSLLMLLGRLEIFGLIQIFFIKWWR